MGIESGRCSEFKKRLKKENKGRVGVYIEAPSDTKHFSAAVELDKESLVEVLI